MQISAKMVKELRDKTGAGMMKCKNALKDTNGNIEEAIDFLRKKGLASADKRSGKATSEGLVVPVVSDDKRTAVILELNCETDFVARNEVFIDFAKKLANFVMENASIKTPQNLNDATMNGKSVNEERKSIVSTIGENVTIGRLERFELADDKFGIFDTYVHGDGTIGVLIHIDTENQDTAAHADTIAYAHEVALQTTAMKPQFVGRKDVAAETIAREKEVILGQIKNDPKNANKPPEIMEKIIEGRLAKYYKEYCLIEQVYVKDDSKTIGSFAEEISKKIGKKIFVADFRRWALGESYQTAETPEEKAAEAAG